MKKYIIVAIAAAFLFIFTASLACADDTKISIDVNNSININNNNVNVDGGSSNNVRAGNSSIGQPVQISWELSEISKIRIDIAVHKLWLEECSRFCYGNLEKRYELVELNMAAYDITKNDKYLEDAMLNAEIAEKNYRNGKDIKQHQSMANQMLRQAKRYWAFGIWKLHGDVAAEKFAAAKGVDVY